MAPSSRRSQSLPTIPGVRIIVAGGGLAGLVAARDLRARGAEVAVVEARDRLGGRVHTLRSNDGVPVHAEAGGDFIEAGQDAILALARELGLATVHVLASGFGLALDHDGRIRVSRTESRAWTALRQVLEPAMRAFEGVDRQWSSAVAASIAGRSLADVLAASRAAPPARGLALALRGFFLADPEHLSALAVVEQLLTAEPGRSRMYRIRGGNDRLIDALATASGATVHLRHVVRAVRQGDAGVEVVVEGPDGRIDVMRANYLVVTVPAPILREVAFTPALPEPQRLAFETLSSGAATKVILRFDRRWWARPGRPNAFGTNLPVGAVWEAAEEQKRAAALVLLAGGSASFALREIIGRHGVRGVLSGLQWLGRIPEPLPSMTVVSWEDDRWARGGYAVFGPEFQPALRPWLSLASGRVLFAGEHTSAEWPGYMNGAVESGQRAADELTWIESLRRLW